MVTDPSVKKLDLNCPIQDASVCYHNQTCTQTDVRCFGTMFGDINGDNPLLPRDSLLSVADVLPTLLAASSDSFACSLNQPTLVPVLGLAEAVPSSVLIARKHLTLLQQSAAHVSTATAFILLLSTAISEVVKSSPFLDSDEEDLHIFQAALAVTSRDSTVLETSAEINLRLLDCDTNLAASSLLLPVKEASPLVAAKCYRIRSLALYTSSSA